MALGAIFCPPKHVQHTRHVRRGHGRARAVAAPCRGGSQRTSVAHERLVRADGVGGDWVVKLGVWMASVHTKSFGKVVLPFFEPVWKSPATGFEFSGATRRPGPTAALVHD